MTEKTAEVPLTEEQKKKILEVIYAHMQDDDPYPYEVIRDKFKGDEDAYLRVMAGWHNVKL